MCAHYIARNKRKRDEDEERKKKKEKTSIETAHRSPVIRFHVPAKDCLLVLHSRQRGRDNVAMAYLCAPPWPPTPPIGCTVLPARLPRAASMLSLSAVVSRLPHLLVVQERLGPRAGARLAPTGPALPLVPRQPHSALLLLLPFAQYLHVQHRSSIRKGGQLPVLVWEIPAAPAAPGTNLSSCFISLRPQAIIFFFLYLLSFFYCVGVAPLTSHHKHIITSRVPCR